MRPRRKFRRAFAKHLFSEPLEQRALLSAVVLQSPVPVASGTTYLQPASIDLGNGHTDIVAWDVTNDLVNVFIAKADGSFNAPISYDTGHAGGVPLLADLGNGHIDMIVSNSTTSGTVDVFIGNGDGTFKAPVNYNIGGTRLSLANLGNGHLDLIGAGSSSINVLIGNGNGAFASLKTLSTGTTPNILNTVDLGNGHPDLIFRTTSPQALNIAIGNGDGTFAAPTVLTQPQSVHAIFVSNLGNGHQDIVINLYDRTTTISALGVLLGNGDGTFAAQVTTPFATPTLLSNLIDLGNGHPDLVYAGTLSTVVQLGNGDGTFQAPVSYPMAFQAAPTIISDLGNGHLDIASFQSGAGQISILTGNGDGTFQTSHLFDTGTTFYSEEVATLNGKHAILYSSLTAMAYVTATTGSGNSLACSLPQFSSTTTDATLQTFSINVDDPSGALLATSNPSITITFGGTTGGTLTGTATVQAVNGTATFSGLMITTPGTYTLSASDGTDYPFNSKSFAVYAAQPLIMSTIAADRAQLNSDTIARNAVKSHAAGYKTAFLATTGGQSDLTQIAQAKDDVKNVIALTHMTDDDEDPEANKFDVKATQTEITDAQSQLNLDLYTNVTQRIAGELATANQLLTHDKNQLAYDTARLAYTAKNRLTPTLSADLAAIYQTAEVASFDHLTQINKTIADQSNSASTLNDQQEDLDADVNANNYELGVNGSGMVSTDETSAAANDIAAIKSAKATAKALNAADNLALRKLLSAGTLALKAAMLKLTKDAKAKA